MKAASVGASEKRGQILLEFDPAASLPSGYTHFLTYNFKSLAAGSNFYRGATVDEPDIRIPSGNTGKGGFPSGDHEIGSNSSTSPPRLLKQLKRLSRIGVS